MHHLDLPEPIKRFINGLPYTEITTSYSGARIYKIISNTGNYYLKYMPAAQKKSIRYESRVTEWLCDKLPVPAVLAFAENESGEYLLMTEVEGETAAEERQLSPEALVRLYAEGLHIVHSVSVEGCPFDHTAAVKIKECLYRCDHRQVKLEYLHESRQGMTLIQLRETLLRAKIPPEDVVFTHGDYCFPNVIVREGRIAGFVDLSHAGVADRYQDIAVGARSVAYNMAWKYKMQKKEAQKYIALFFEAYGLRAVDEEKIEFYTLLDDFNR